MNRQVISLIALNDVLRLVFRRMPLVTVKDDFRGHYLANRPPNSPRLGVPLDMIAAFEFSWHCTLLFHALSQLSRGVEVDCRSGPSLCSNGAMKDWLTDPEPKYPLAKEVLDAVCEVCRLAGKVLLFLLTGAWLW
jgi:hypothetical protein